MDWLLLLCLLCALPIGYSSPGTGCDGAWLGCVSTTFVKLIDRYPSDCLRLPMNTCHQLCATRGLPLYGLEHTGCCRCAMNLRAIHPNGTSMLGECGVCSIGNASYTCGKEAGVMSLCLKEPKWPSVMGYSCYPYNRSRLTLANVPVAVMKSYVQTFYHGRKENTELRGARALIKVTMCAAFCLRHGYPMAAMGNYYHCVCGHRPNPKFYALSNSGQTCKGCMGDDTVKCGLSKSIAVYSILIETPSLTLTSNLAANTVAHGESVTINCQVTNDLWSPIHYIWRRDGKILDVSNSTKKVELDVKRKTVVNCEAINMISTTKSANKSIVIRVEDLQMKIKPTHLKTQPTNGSVELSCSINSVSEDFRYWWFKGSKLLSTSRSLVIPQLKRGDDGIYKCIAKDVETGQHAEKLMELIVRDSPQPTIQPPHKTAAIGQAVVALCKHNKGLISSWWRICQPGKLIVDLCPIDNSSGFTCPHALGLQLVLVNVSNELDGEYMCLVRTNTVRPLTAAALFRLTVTDTTESGEDSSKLSLAMDTPCSNISGRSLSSPDTTLSTGKVSESSIGCVSPSCDQILTTEHVATPSSVTVPAKPANTSTACSGSGCVSATVANNKQSSDSNQMLVIVIAAVAGVCSVLVFVIIVLCLRRRKSTKAKVTPPQQLGLQHNLGRNPEDETSRVTPRRSVLLNGHGSVPVEVRRALNGRCSTMPCSSRVSNQFLPDYSQPTDSLTQRPSETGLAQGKNENYYTETPYTVHQTTKQSPRSDSAALPFFKFLQERKTNTHQESASSASSAVKAKVDYDHLWAKKLYTSPFVAPPDTEMAIYSHLYHQGYHHIDHNDLTFAEEIGCGQFGVVLKGVWRKNNHEVDVAIKTMRPGLPIEDRVGFLQEAAIMGQFKHPNVIFLHGVCTSSTCDTVMMILELMGPLNLRQHVLNANPPNKSPTAELINDLLRMSKDVANGMIYLSGRSFVHRDLAARNILLDHNGTCKISDFGLSREMVHSNYYFSNGKVIPIRWTAPEAILVQQYSTASDVWSFGVLLYEIWSFGRRPYHLWNNERVVDEVQRGYRLPKPDHCPNDVYELMQDCWEHDHHHRPTFTVIAASLADIRVAPPSTDNEPGL